MGKSSSAPASPNPVATANAQTASNRETAITQAGLNMVDQTDALGNKLQFNQNGTWSDGTPRFSATQTLSAPQQQLLNTGVATQQNLANLAQEQSGRLSGLLNQELDWSAQQNYLNDLTRQNLDPQWNQMQEANEQELINRGLRPGSDAYNRAKDQFLQSRSSAFNNANLNNYNSALQSQLSLRQAPLNEILALSGQGQVATPAFSSTPQTGVAGTDVAGIMQSDYNNRMGAYNQQQQGNNSMMGGLMSAGSSLLGGLFGLSDRRAKKNIKRVGKTDSGVNIYVFEYLHGGGPQMGVMAQELQETHPHAVVEGPDGLLRVQYELVD